MDDFVERRDEMTRRMIESAKRNGIDYVVVKVHFDNQKNNVPPHTKVCGLIGTCF